MSTNTICPSCQRPLRVPENLLGQQVKCPVCETTFLAADPTEEVPARAPQPEPERSPQRADREDRERHRERDRERDGGREWEREDRDRRSRDPDRGRRRYDEDEDYPRPRSAGGAKPGKVQALGVMMLVGGIIALVFSGAIVVFSCGIGLVWPGSWIAVVAGILGIVRGSAFLGDQAHRQSSPTVVAVLQILCVLNGDMVNLTLGIIELIFLNDPEVKGYLRG